MNAFLWFIVVIGFLEMIGTCFYALRGKVPQRTAGGMAFNAVFWSITGVWALWLVVRL